MRAQMKRGAEVNVGRCLSHRATGASLLSSDMGHRPSDLASFNNFAERLAVGIFANEAWVDNVPSIAWEGSYAAKWTNRSASFAVDVHSSTVCRQTRARSTRSQQRTGLCRGKVRRCVLVARNVEFRAVTTMGWEACPDK
jgi:hypothetical protein